MCCALFSIFQCDFEFSDFLFVIFHFDLYVMKPGYTGAPEGGAKKSDENGNERSMRIWSSCVAELRVRHLQQANNAVHLAKSKSFTLRFRNIGLRIKNFVD